MQIVKTVGFIINGLLLYEGNILIFAKTQVIETHLLS